MLNDNPPIDPGPLPDERPSSRWPTVIGVLSLIYAICGLLCALGITTSGFLTEMMMAMGGMKVQMPTILKIVNGVSGVLLLIAGVMLIAGAAGTLRRKRSGPAMLRKWVIYRITLLLLGSVAAIVTAPAQIQFQRSMLDAQITRMAESGQQGSIPDVTDEQLWTRMMISMAVVTVLFAIYPLFVGFYLSRRKITDEVAGWQ